MPYTAADIAKQLDGEISGEGSLLLTGFAPADTARTGDLTFAENEDYFTRAERSAASAILVSNRFTSSSKVLIRVANARVAFAKVLPLFFPEPKFAAGVHPTAQLAATSQVHPTAHIGAFCVVGERAKVGPRAVLEGGDHVGADCDLAADVHLSPNVVLYPRTQVGQCVRIHAGTV